MQVQIEQPPRQGLLGRFFSGLGRWLTTIRRWVFNLLTLVVLMALVSVLLRACTSDQVVLKDKTALVLDLKGQLVEEKSTPDDSLLSLATSGELTSEVQLRDVLAVLKAAADDPNITRILLKLDDFAGGGLASLRDVAAGLQGFKASGKPVIAWGSHYSQAQYFLAAQANEVLLDPAGVVMLDGLGGESSYYAEALEKAGVKVHVVRTGPYKNMAEQFTDKAPSTATLEASAYLLDDLWSLVTSELEAARELPKGKIMQLINALPEPLEAAGGDLAKMALDQGLVTGLKDIQQVRDEFIQAGAEDTDNHTFRQVNYEAYLANVAQPINSGAGVGIIVAEGEIIDGTAPRQTIGGESTAALVRKARLDETIKAIVLRVNSPGGAVFGSELIRRELAAAREAGKPVVVSMGDVAASGGYWIATASDKIYADAATITGSIGVITLFPTLEGLMDKLGVHQGGYATTWLKTAGDPLKPLDPRFERLLAANIQATYKNFLGHVSQARNMSVEAVNAVAQGRVWTGRQALDRGLVDALGGLQAALSTAKQLANLDEKTPARYIESDESEYSWLLEKLWGAQLFSDIQAYLPEWLAPSQLPAEFSTLQADVLQFKRLLKPDQPFSTIVHCFCTAELDSKRSNSRQRMF
ncbi:protease-4 [Thiothrix eikelboomii]|uniref:Protease-4 n=1 Tax=Thiothrix eikelboomii TaxID=92487 RepID=A0A1T4W352_9GAMM|nr:signal peptide peptidase SppA [Thiothrix eikelboomii]SKA71682.1 protease-4 [Thiothrix eikelboomii]